MVPYKLIHIGEVYQNPITMGEWLVLDKDDDEKMIQVVLMGGPVKPIWVKNTHRIFNYNLVLRVK